MEAASLFLCAPRRQKPAIEADDSSLEEYGSRKLTLPNHVGAVCWLTGVSVWVLRKNMARVFDIPYFAIRLLVTGKVEVELHLRVSYLGLQL